MSQESHHKPNELERDEKTLKLVRTLVRSMGPLLFLVMLTLAIGQGGLDRLVNLTGAETIIFVCILTMFFGILWSYTHEIAGGSLIIVAYFAMAITTGKIIPGTVYPIFFIIGILHIYCALLEKSIEKRR